MSPRRTALALCLILGTARLAVADGGAPRVGLSRVLDQRQALVLDESRDDYVVVKVGDTVQGFRVAAIGADQIVLEGGAPSRRYVVALAGATPAPAAAASTPTTDVLIDPYPFGAASDVMDPYGAGPAIPQVKAPSGSRAATAPATAPPPVGRSAGREPTAKGDSPGSRPAPAIGHIADLARAPAPAARADHKTRPRVRKVRIRRAELDAALADFARLGREVVVETTADGVVVREVAAAGFFHHLGLRAGDTITEVAGRRITTIDDAAEVYVAAQAARTLDVVLVRDGAPVRLAITVTR